jgi:Tol biopolymer transport system component
VRTLRHALAALVAVVSLVLAVATLPAATGPAAARASGPTLGVQAGTVVLPGRRVAVRGLLRGSPVRRTVLLQVDRGGRWVSVERQRTFERHYSFYGLRAPRRAGTLRLRTVAPRERVAGRVRPRVVSRVLRVRVSNPTVRLSGPASAPVGSRVTVRAVVRSPRAAFVQLEQKVNGAWVYVAGATTAERTGATRIAFTQLATGPSTYRAKVRRSDGFATDTIALSGTGTPPAYRTRRVSVAGNGAQVTGYSGLDGGAAVSDSGRYVAFTSRAAALAPRDRNEVDDVFVKDLVTGTVRRVSSTPAGAAGDRRSWAPAISGDARFVAFVSRARDLVRGATSGSTAVYLWDRTTGGLRRVATGADPALDADGSHLVLSSAETDLVTGDGNGRPDVFRYATATRTFERVSQTAAGADSDGGSAAPSISDDGARVAYRTTATNLAGGRAGVADVVVWDAATGETTLASPSTPGVDGRDATTARISGDGSTVAFAAVTPAESIFGEPVRQTFVVPATGGTPVLVSAVDGAPGDGDSWPAAFTTDGSRLLLGSDAPLTDDDVDDAESPGEAWPNVDYATDSYLLTLTGDGGGVSAVELVSRGHDGEVTDLYAGPDDLTADGGEVVFTTRSSVVPGQTRRYPFYEEYLQYDVFVRDLR